MPRVRFLCWNRNVIQWNLIINKQLWAKVNINKLKLVLWLNRVEYKQVGPATYLFIKKLPVQRSFLNGSICTGKHMLVLFFTNNVCINNVCSNQFWICIKHRKAGNPKSRVPFHLSWYQDGSNYNHCDITKETVRNIPLKCFSTASHLASSYISVLSGKAKVKRGGHNALQVTSSPLGKEICFINIFLS